MKNFTFIFIITTGLVVPTLSHAGGTASGIGASFERDLNRQPVITCAVRQEIDPVQYRVNSTLRGGSSQLATSFERDLNRQPVITYAVRQEVDPIQHLINSTLRGSSNPAFASLHGVTTLD